MCGSDIFLGLIAIILPPFAVWVKRGLCSADSFINLALCCLGFLPGLIHAWYIISVYPDPTYDQVPQEPEDGRVTYYYVDQQGARQPTGNQGGYGTIGSAPANGQFPGQQQGSAPPQQYRQEQQQPSGSRPDEVPPTYAEAVKGNHKIQSHD